MTALRANAILCGGPSEKFAVDERVRHIADLGATLKYLRGNRYEHFEPTPEKVQNDDLELQVFEWTGCTQVAE
ncbi:MAG: DUF5988 family protein [Actinomycetota bacterium]|nr:DUF5988 family protein [Actinomycetota bacterium]